MSRRSGFVAEIQLLVTTAPFAHQLRNGVRRVVECAEIPHLAVAARFCHRDRVVRLGGINPDENLAPLLHGSSPVRRGVPGPSGQPRSIRTQAASGLNSTADMRLTSMGPSPDVELPHA
jgi:hypothetical protein